MATITKRGPYQWRAQVRRHGYPAQSKTFNTKAEAEAWANMIESEMSRGIWVSRSEAETTTLYEILARYETEVSVAKKGQHKRCQSSEHTGPPIWRNGRWR